MCAGLTFPRVLLSYSILSYHWKVSNRLFCRAYTYRLRYGPVTIELLINNYYLYQLKLTAARLNKKGTAQ